uniref:Uncharacterized protein n=1 Tax=Arundo donax TaxID=35708 RepID=A0A0A9HE83_ARUDO
MPQSLLKARWSSFFKFASQKLQFLCHNSTKRILYK